MSEDNHNNLQEVWNKLNELISYVYKQYKERLPEADRRGVEEFLDNREYELALTEFVAVLKHHKIALDAESTGKLKEACERMKISLPEYLRGWWKPRTPKEVEFPFVASYKLAGEPLRGRRK